MIIFGELWDILHDTKASRVYIVQPHPLGHEEMITIDFEVKEKGIEPMKPHIQSLNISEVPKFASELVENSFMYITDIGEQIVDEYACSILASYGTKKVVIKRLSDNRHDWVGSIFCEFTQDLDINEKDIHKLLNEAALSIQYILPEIENNDNNK